jgi:outer membrane protein TolC
MAVRRARRATIPIILASLLAFAGVPVNAADQRIPLTIAAAEDLALRNEPGEASLRSRAHALRERSVAAGQLPDPVMRIALANYPLERGGFSTEGMTQAQIGVRQAFPRRAVRSADTERLQFLAEDLTAGAEARSRDVLVATRMAWLESFYWQRAIELLDESRPLFEDLVTITRSLYSVGRKSQFDVLQAELELRRLDDRLIAAQRKMSAAQAALSQWLGDDAYRPVATTLPGWNAVPEISDLQRRLLEHPLLHAADARLSAQQSAVDLADEKKKPGWALDLGYAYREGFLPSGEPRSDFISVAVTVDLPFFSGNRQDRELAAALANRTAAEESRRTLLAELNSELLVQHAAWSDLTRRMELYETQILNMSSASADAALLAYRSDAGDFADVLRGTVNDLNTRLEYIRLEVERAKIYAALANLGGLPR